jgi:hypothetical protein
MRADLCRDVSETGNVRFQSLSHVDPMTPILITPEIANYITISLAVLVYYLLVRFDWAFMSPADRYDDSPFQLFIRKWFGNILSALFIASILRYFAIGALVPLSFGALQLDPNVFGKPTVNKGAWSLADGPYSNKN